MRDTRASFRLHVSPFQSNLLIILTGEASAFNPFLLAKKEGFRLYSHNNSLLLYLLRDTSRILGAFSAKRSLP